MRNTLSLKALTTKQEEYTFDIQDIPVMMDEAQFVLMARPGSPILLADTVVTGSDIPGIFEGTTLKDEQGQDYLVSFKRGFAAMGSMSGVRKMSEVGNYTITGYKSVESISLCRQRILFKYNDIQFQFRDFVGIINGNPIIKESYTPIDPAKLRQYAGLTYNGKPVFLGDIIDGCTVTMHNGRICIDKGDYFIDLADNAIME